VPLTVILGGVFGVWLSANRADDDVETLGFVAAFVVQRLGVEQANRRRG